jgi:hypothetical protein
MSLAFSTGARAVSSGPSSARRPAAAAAAARTPRRRRARGRPSSLVVRADLHGLVAVSSSGSSALFPPSRQMSGASTPSRPGSSLSHGAPADPSKREAFARVLKASLLGLTAALAGGNAQQQQQQRAQPQPQRSASPAFQLPPEVLEAEEEAAESSGSGGWGRSHIAERLATRRVSKVAPPLDDGDH